MNALRVLSLLFRCCWRWLSAELTSALRGAAVNNGNYDSPPFPLQESLLWSRWCRLWPDNSTEALRIFGWCQHSVTICRRHGCSKSLIVAVSFARDLALVLKMDRSGVCSVVFTAGPDSQLCFSTFVSSPCAVCNAWRSQQ